jgi:hypothetical protein
MTNDARSSNRHLDPRFAEALGAFWSVASTGLQQGDLKHRAGIEVHCSLFSDRGPGREVRRFRDRFAALSNNGLKALLPPRLLQTPRALRECAAFYVLFRRNFLNNGLEAHAWSKKWFNCCVADPYGRAAAAHNRLCCMAECLSTILSCQQQVEGLTVLPRSQLKAVLGELGGPW